MFCVKHFQNCANNRRKRSLVPFGKESSESTTISVGPLYMAKGLKHFYSFLAIFQEYLSYKVSHFPFFFYFIKDSPNAEDSEYTLVRLINTS